MKEKKSVWNNKKLSLCAGEEAAGAKPESANRMAQQAVCHWKSSKFSYFFEKLKKIE